MSKDVIFETKDKGLNIINSYMIDDVAYMYCHILHLKYNNMKTKRKCKNLVAEWLFHNWCYKHHIMRSHSKDTFLDNELTGFRGTIEKIIYRIIEVFI